MYHFIFLNQSIIDRFLMITILLVLCTFNFHGMESCWPTGTKHHLECYETATVVETPITSEKDM